MDDRVAELKALVADGDESALTARIATYVKWKDKRVDDVLLGVARSSRFEAASCAAMRVLAAHQDSGYLAWAKSRLYDKKMLENHPTEYLAILDSLPAAGEALKPYLRDLSNVIQDHMKARPDVATRAVAAYGAVHEKSVVVQLISLLEKTEGEASGGGGGKGRQAPPNDVSGSGSGGGSDSRGNLLATGAKICEVLKALTGGEGSTSTDWKNWWYTHDKAFRFPAPDPDWATIDAFEDALYGLVLKKPGAGVWSFEKCQYDGGRARLKCLDGTVVQASVDVLTYAKGGVASVQDFAEGFESKWRIGGFSEFAEKGEPAVTKKRIGGREFAVIAARGTGDGAWKDWDACERRTYVTMGDSDTILTLEAAVREGFDAAQKAAFWDALEHVTFKTVK